MEGLRSMQYNRNNNNNNRTNPSGGGGTYQGGGEGGLRNSGTSHNDAPLQCSGCKSKKIHPEIGRRGCPVKDYSNTVARKMAKHAEELIGGGKTKPQAINESIQKHQHDTD
jgi:hypothetical protein